MSCPISRHTVTQWRHRQWFKLSPYSDWTCICCGINYVSSATEHISLCKPLVITSIEHRPWVNTCKTTNGLLVSRCCVLKCMPHSDGLRTVMGGGHTKPQATFPHPLPHQWHVSHRSLNHLRTIDWGTQDKDLCLADTGEKGWNLIPVWERQICLADVSVKVLWPSSGRRRRCFHCGPIHVTKHSVACWLGRTQYHTFQSVLQEYQFWPTNLVRFEECLLVMCNMYTYWVNWLWADT